MDRRSENVGRRPKIIMKSTGWTAPTEPSASAYVNYISCLQTLRFVAKTSGHLFVRKNYNAPHPPGKSWSTIDRAFQNCSQLFGVKHIVKTKTVSLKNKKGQRILLSGSQMASACQLKSEGGLNSHRTQYGLIDCTGGGTEFYGTQNARIITIISCCFCGEYH